MTDDALDEAAALLGPPTLTIDGRTYRVLARALQVRHIGRDVVITDGGVTLFTVGRKTYVRPRKVHSVADAIVAGWLELVPEAIQATLNLDSQPSTGGRL